MDLEVRLTAVCQHKTKRHPFNRYEFVTVLPFEKDKRFIIISITRQKSDPGRITLRSESWRQQTGIKRQRLLNDTFRGIFYFSPMTTIAIKK